MPRQKTKEPPLGFDEDSPAASAANKDAESLLKLHEPVPTGSPQQNTEKPAIERDEDILRSHNDVATGSTVQESKSVGFSSSVTLLNRAATGFWRQFNTTGHLEEIDGLDTSSHLTTPDEQEAKDHIAHFFATDTELNTLCNAILSKSDETKFAAIAQPALEVFYKGLLADAVTDLEKKSVSLLKSQRGRARISHMIPHIVSNTLEEDDRMKAEEQN
jgi:hypothetical protein